MPWLNQQTVILVLGVLLLVAPYIHRVLAIWIGSMVFPTFARGDFEKRTATELIDLKNRLEKEGHAKAASLCKELILAVLYGDAKP